MLPIGVLNFPGRISTDWHHGYPTQSQQPATSPTPEQQSKHSTDWEDEELSLLGYGSTRAPFRVWTALRRRFPVFFVLIPWITNVFLGIAAFYCWHSRPLNHGQFCIYGPGNPPEAYTPAAEVLEFVPVIFKDGLGGDMSPYQGWPTDEKDEMWQQLYRKGVSLHFTSSEHAPLVNKTEHVPVAGYEDEYFAGLDVFHQLHCLNQIRMAFYPRRYNTSMFNPDGRVNYLQWMHVDHCIESIRSSLTCNADISVNGYTWSDSQKRMIPTLRTVHMCRSFEKIRDWAFDRFVNVPAGTRVHVENGKVVDYSGWGGEIKEEDLVPSGWEYTVDDL